MKLGADRGFFVERAALFLVTSRLFCLERPCRNKAAAALKNAPLFQCGTAANQN
jgi:hypothetical protein